MGPAALVETSHTQVSEQPPAFQSCSTAWSPGRDQDDEEEVEVMEEQGDDGEEEDEEVMDITKDEDAKEDVKMDSENVKEAKEESNGNAENGVELGGKCEDDD